MAEIPRKPTFPLHMIEKLLAKIESQVNDDVIPVSTGIYSYEKLKNKLEAIPKPEIENYDDKIFFEVIEDRLSPPDKTGEKCPTCEEEYHMKKNPAMMCNFCGFWCCNNCMPVRKRPHPLSKDANGKRYNICQRCDTKYLNLQLGHSYVENRTLLEQAIAKTSEELENFKNKCKEYQEVVAKSKQTFEKNKFKIAQLKKEKLDLNKDIKTKMPEEIKSNELRTEELKQRFVEVHLQHKEWLEMSQSRKRIWEEEKERERVQKEKEKIERERIQKEEEERERLRLQIEREEQEEEERLEKERRETERLQKERENEEIKLSKLKKTPSLSQNITLNMSLSYNSETKLEDKKVTEKIPQTEIDEKSYETEEKIRKMSIENEEIETAVKQVNEQKIIESIEFLEEPIRQSEKFREYFAEENQENEETEEEYFSHQYKTSNKKIFDESEEKQELKNEEKPYEENQKDKYVSNFTFDEKIIDQLKPHETTWHFHEKERKKSQNIENLEDIPFTFDQKNEEQNHLNDEIEEKDVENTKKEEIQEVENNYEEDNHLSFVDEWYVKKETIVPENESTLSSILNNPSYEKSYFTTKRNKTPEELEEECSKSTSELDEEEIEVARYSLLKAARDNAVQEREKNKIYQRSIHEMAPYDEEEETVGEIKKCECSIY